jgi:hypothetical protein
MQENKEKEKKEKKFKFKVDKDMFEVEKAAITGREILEISGNAPPENFRLDQKLKGGNTKKIELIDVVNLDENGTEHFMTVKLNLIEG